MQTKFYGHGKLMLTGEYFVLDGAKSLALPSRFGQSLKVEKLPTKTKKLFWKSIDNKGGVWLKCVFDKDNFDTESLQKEAKVLAEILKVCKMLKPEFLKDEEDIQVQTQLEFPRDWGLGSSSTLIYCIAKWADVNPFVLLEKTLGGSGYDVTCAASDLPVLFSLENGMPIVETPQFNPQFKEQILFVHLGKKQLSTAGIAHYHSLNIDKQQYISHIDEITNGIILCKTIKEFMLLLETHENYVAKALQLPKVKETYFKNIPAVAKSLGAWGGDFVLLAFEENKEIIKKMLYEIGFETVLTWNEIILSRQKHTE